MPHCAGCRPVQIVEITHEIRPITVILVESLIGLEYLGLPLLPIRPSYILEFVNQFVPFCFIVLGLYYPLRFPALHIKKDAGVIASPSPRLGP